MWIERMKRKTDHIMAIRRRLDGGMNEWATIKRKNSEKIKHFSVFFFVSMSQQHAYFRSQCVFCVPLNHFHIKVHVKWPTLERKETAANDKLMLHSFSFQANNNVSLSSSLVLVVDVPSYSKWPTFSILISLFFVHIFWYNFNFIKLLCIWIRIDRRRFSYNCLFVQCVGKLATILQP